MSMTIRVHEVNQTASGGSFVCIFDADIELNASGDVQVVVASVDPPDTPSDLIESASEAIREGAKQVLHPRGQGAFIKIVRLVIHMIDFKPSKFTFYTIRELQTLLQSL